MKEALRDRADTGSGLIIDMGRERRHTMDSSSDQNFFQRALLRVSNRFRKHSRARAATISKLSRQERVRQLNQPSSSNGLAGDADRRESQTLPKADVSQLPIDLNKKLRSMGFKGRSNSHGEFYSEAGRQARVKAKGRNELMQRTTTPVQSKVEDAAALSRPLNTSISTSGRVKSSAGSASMISTRSRGLSSTTSDVFTDDVDDNNKQSLPPVAPPRSPVSLGIFTFSDSPDGKDESEASEYLNREGIDELTGRKATASTVDTSEVILRRRVDDSSLLDEIDREIKRRTREEDVPSTPLSCTSINGPNSFDFYDNEEGQNYVLLRTTDTGPSVDVSNTDHQTRSRKQSSDLGYVGNREPFPVANGNSECGRTLKQDYNLDPGVHSPNKVEDSGEEAAYQNVSEIIGNRRDSAASKGHRNSTRRSSSKHLSDPLLTERLGNILQRHNDNVASSLRELPHETNYVNFQGDKYSQDNASSYVNFNAGGASERKLRKKKPSPLNINFEKYDDDENIYHIVGPLLNDNRSDSADGVNCKNTGVGSYENIAGRSATRNNRAYVNVPSPTRKKFVPMLNYVLVSGPKGGSSRTYRDEKSSSLNSVNSDKSDKVQYSFIDEKATSLLQRTREQHWQRRAEDGQAKLNTPTKTKKSFGD